MELRELMGTIRDVLSARRVFGEPVERDGVVVIPAAVVIGGGGGGVGNDGAPQEGGGFGLVARPVGAFVISNGTARWVPAVDVGKLAVLGGVVVAAWLMWRRARAIGR